MKAPELQMFPRSSHWAAMMRPGSMKAGRSKEKLVEHLIPGFATLLVKYGAKKCH